MRKSGPTSTDSQLGAYWHVKGNCICTDVAGELDKHAARRYQTASLHISFKEQYLFIAAILPLVTLTV